MPKVTEILAKVGSSDIHERIRDKGGSPDAQEEVAMEMVVELHLMLKALLLMHGRNTGQTMSEEEATLAAR